MIKLKEKENHDVRKELDNVTHNLSQLKAEFATFSSIVNKERKTNERKSKRKCLNVGTVPTFKKVNVGTVPTFNPRLNVGTVPAFKKLNVGTLYFFQKM